MNVIAPNATYTQGGWEVGAKHLDFHIETGVVFISDL